MSKFCFDIMGFYTINMASLPLKTDKMLREFPNKDVEQIFIFVR